MSTCVRAALLVAVGGAFGVWSGASLGQQSPGAAPGMAPPPGGPPSGAAPAGGPPPGMPPRPAALPDNAAAAAHRAAGKLAAGDRWDNAYQYLCVTGPTRGSLQVETIKPQWIFDNLALIGDRNTVMFVLKTSAGILLIDSGYSDKLDSVLLPSLAKLGIEPASVKTIVISHGHADHYGGAPYFQAHYGTRIVASAADWDVMAAGPPAMMPPHPEPWMLAKAPARDVVVDDGGEIVQGDLHIKAFLIPGHTPGSLGFVFPVKDGGKLHMAGIFGGTILDAGFITTDGLRQYVQSLTHFAEVTHERNVDVELQNHPFFDDMWVKADALAARKPGAANPFVVGDAGYQSFLTVMSECMQSTLARRP